jgi:hypothetical protein
MRLVITEPGKIIEAASIVSLTDETVEVDVTFTDPLKTSFGAWSNRPEVLGDWWIDAQSLEADIGRQLDLYRTYHQVGNLPTSAREREVFGTLAHRGIINWKPSNSWPDASGSSPTINTQIATVGTNLRDLDNPIDLAVYHEPKDNMNATNTVDAYHAMWANVANIFSSVGADNVRLVYVATGFEGNHDIEEQLFPPQAQVAAYDPYVGNATLDPFAHFDASYGWWADDARPWGGLPIGWAEWGIGLNPYTPTPERQALAFLDLADAFDAGAWPKLDFISYFDSNYAKVQPGAIPAFATLANLPRFTNS